MRKKRRVRERDRGVTVTVGDDHECCGEVRYLTSSSEGTGTQHLTYLMYLGLLWAGQVSGVYKDTRLDSYLYLHSS